MWAVFSIPMIPIVVRDLLAALLAYSSFSFGLIQQDKKGRP